MASFTHGEGAALRRRGGGACLPRAGDRELFLTARVGLCRPRKRETARPPLQQAGAYGKVRAGMIPSTSSSRSYYYYSTEGAG